MPKTYSNISVIIYTIPHKYVVVFWFVFELQLQLEPHTAKAQNKTESDRIGWEGESKLLK